MTLISQSLITRMLDYKAGNECGLKIEARYVNGIQFPSTVAQKLGQYFEWKATGQRNYDGEIPEPEYLKDGETLTTAYRRADEQADNFKRYLKAHKWTVEEAGKRWEVNGMSALTDAVIRVEPGGVWPWGDPVPDDTRFIMDLKYTGGLHASFGEYAWGSFTDGYQKPKIATQATHYTEVTGLPFLFAVFSSGPDMGVRLIPTVINVDTAFRHDDLVNETRKMFKLNNRTGWVAKPEYSRCKTCPLFDECEHRHEWPMPEVSVVI